jgi:2,3-bisphosphoglycerate-dependent phosphoglycerate mutase
MNWLIILLIFGKKNLFDDNKVRVKYNKLHNQNMADQLTLIVFRHGETSFNKERIFCGWINTWLDARGITQAQILGKTLAGEKIDYGFCSDLIRSKQTLAYVLSHHKKAKVIVDPRIKERNYGVFSGHSKELFKQLFPEKYDEIHRGYYTDIPKGENFMQVSQRVAPFMNDLIRFMKKEKVNVCISAHGNSMRSIVEYLEELSPKQVEQLEFKPTDYKKYRITFEC